MPPENKSTLGRRLLFLLPVAAFVALAVTFALGLGHDPTMLKSAMIDKPAPAFALEPVMTDRPGLARADLGGKPMLVNFFASWCVPCREEHAELDQLAHAGVPLVGIDYKDRAEDGRTFLKELGDPYARIGADRDGRVAIDFGVYGVPETFVVDGSGRIRYRYPGAVTPEVAERTLKPLLKSLQ